jgi:hypothetical protein
MRHDSTIGSVFENRSWFVILLIAIEPIGRTSTAVAHVGISISYQIVAEIQDIGAGGRTG